jgi:hypothetical protein
MLKMGRLDVFRCLEEELHQAAKRANGQRRNGNLEVVLYWVKDVSADAIEADLHGRTRN